MQSSSHPPTVRTATASLLSTLSQLPSVSPSARLPLITLHVLHPTSLLPALDLLDRHLVTRLVPRSDASLPVPDSSRASAARRGAYTVLSTRSPPASARKDFRHRSPSQGKGYGSIAARLDDTLVNDDDDDNDNAALQQTYVVHTGTWSCSCPAFAFSLFPADAAHGRSTGSGAGDGQGGVAALLRGEDVPMCKHLMACVLAERCGGMVGSVATREVGVGELVAWGAGWGG
ncbi:hypothetical protein K461DRAFT_276069 [Myriangium duriaei CBS 260.36]|uniref:SWIM-type domain-containing protein n=1 Tax=Myriangium duriaei CBS 260.36 TaxID=1168546 RepID=A0A9P4J7L4_9PEZI|nr:hypothetical protein K461DRAFT_276069 [Myriangium duriaei CBS 260.36]